MENWSARDDDHPYHLTAARRARRWPAVVLAVAVLAGLVGYYYYHWLQQQAQRAPVTTPPAATIAAPEPQASPEPATRHPLPAPKAQASLPTLAHSDAMARDSVVALIGRKAFEARVVPDQLIRRIVATVDNLPRPTAPRRKMPLNPVKGAFLTARTGDEIVIGAANFARYAPFVRVMESVDPRALVSSYIRAYPLFQRAYEELGYPGKYFNDRLMEALDDMLDAPEIDAPIKLVRPRILYQFADPDLEARSAGQKILLRMGRENASRVKAKLREIRRELVAAGAPRG
jgi:hypothetical protein